MGKKGKRKAATEKKVESVCSTEATHPIDPLDKGTLCFLFSSDGSEHPQDGTNVSNRKDNNELEHQTDDAKDSENEPLEDSDNGSDKGDNEFAEELEKEELAFKKKTISTEELKKFQEKIEKTGVVYISRIPPRMAVNKLRRLLSRFSVKIGRIYLAPEDPQIRKKRKISGGTRQKMYTEGWIEFMDKNKAKSLVKMLNNTNMDPKKHSYHHEDIWNLKYLPKFKWSHLTERIAYEKQARTQKLQAEIAQSKKINQQYITKVEQAKMIKKIESKKRTQSDSSSKSQPPTKVMRHFQQKETIFSEAGPAMSKSKKATSGPKDKKLDSVLSKIFE
ncbi:RNA-binding ATPase activator esf2 [Entomophthora muscae]|uniref:RNA-binding ATPase activator esf2 n=1 Tax=Entomophthora muscae TaxID=34485 RepID=A0ACC2T2I2_9FUNG|nr:RNA-binding ATPase activator esf2 [Entomophthora muscae]